MATLDSARFLPEFVADLAAAIEAVGGTDVTVGDGSGVTGPGWSIPLTVTGALRGTATLVLDAPGVTALLHLVLGPEADTSEPAARDLLTELSNQAIGALCLKDPFTTVSVSLGPLTLTDAPGDQPTRLGLSLGETTLQVGAQVALEVAVSPQPPAAPPASKKAAAAGPATPGNLDVVLDIELPLSVRFGSTVMSIRSLSAIGPGSIVDMGRSPDDPVEILVCGRPIARAEVVIVGGNYGVRITDLTSATERIRAMEGQL